MLDIRRKKVKAIYFNAFHCPECGLELHRDDIVLMTYPAQYSYYCDCGFCTTTTQQPGYEYEFEDDDMFLLWLKKFSKVLWTVLLRKKFQMSLILLVLLIPLLFLW